DVDAGAPGDHGAQHGEVGVRLHREADDVLAPLEGLVEHLEVALERRVAVDVGRCAYLLGDAGEGDGFAVQLVAAVVEMMHARTLCGRTGAPPSARRRSGWRSRR